ncbi:hypothetical protein JCM19235_3137 [Vibrio maritimus]|uniref:Uncharacterized protein n=1 Tax=Vibrio maritimus TaxID=990268 RepID=A0A090ST90_9VIBR|nr:hypothetical protein JCM19235_3137 [Vibrio maritimus]
MRKDVWWFETLDVEKPSNGWLLGNVRLSRLMVNHINAINA